MKIDVAGTVWVAGLAAVATSLLLLAIVVLAILQLAMASSAKRVLLSYTNAITGKVALATLASKYTILRNIVLVE